MANLSPLGGSFFQFGYVTRNLEAAQALFAARYGVPHFLVMDTREIADWEGPHVRAAMAYRGDTMVEIIEPLTAPNIYAEALPKGDSVNLHHLAFYLTQDAWDALPAAIAAHGYGIAFQTPAAMPLKVIYVDTRRDLGHYVELVLESDVTRALFAALPRFADR